MCGRLWAPGLRGASQRTPGQERLALQDGRAPLDRGVLEVNASVAEVMKQVKQKTTLLVAISGDNDAAGKVLEEADIVESVESRVDHLLVTLKKEAEDYSDLPTMLIQAGHKITMFREEEINLESAFMALTKGMGQQVAAEPAK